MLSAPACLAESVMNSDQMGHSDLLVFTFASISPEPSWHERRHALETNQGLFLIYLLPDAWQTIPQPWKLTSDSQEEIDLELGGLTRDRSDFSQSFYLPPQSAVEIAPGAARIAFLATRQIPNGTITIQAAQSRHHQILPHHWGNLWVESDLILLVGVISVGEFRRCARHARIDPAWSDLPLPARGLSLPVRELSRLADYLPG